jgi:hypothetical protein
MDRPGHASASVRKPAPFWKSLKGEKKLQQNHKQNYDIARAKMLELLGIDSIEKLVGVETKNGVEPFRFSVYLVEGVEQDVATIPVSHARGEGQPTVAMFARVKDGEATLIGWEFWRILTMGDKTAFRPGEDVWVIDARAVRPMADIRFRIMGEFEE